MRVVSAARIEDLAADGVSGNAGTESGERNDVGGIEIRLDRAPDVVDDPGKSTQKVALAQLRAERADHQLLPRRSAVVVAVVP